MNCERCGEYVVLAGIGQRPRFCSTRCRVAAYRESKRNPFPIEMTARNSWTRCMGKRPIQVNGAPASSTNPLTWSSFDSVKPSNVIQCGDGFGIMLGDGLGCYDLDHFTDAEAREFIDAIVEPVLLVERSVSGDGFHVFVAADESAGTKRGNVERYTRARFIRVTGNIFKL